MLQNTVKTVNTVKPACFVLVLEDSVYISSSGDFMWAALGLAKFCSHTSVRVLAGVIQVSHIGL